MSGVRAASREHPGQDTNPGEKAPPQPTAVPVSNGWPGDVDVILPVLDERQALPGVLASLPGGYRPIVVDNGSTDGSSQLAAELGATVVREPVRGFGAACFADLRAAAADLVCFMDADGSLDGADLPLVVQPVAAGEADLVLGRRQAVPGAWPLHARLANRELCRRLRRRCGLRIRDLGPMRAAWPLRQHNPCRVDREAPSLGRMVQEQAVAGFSPSFLAWGVDEYPAKTTTDQRAAVGPAGPRARRACSMTSLRAGWM